MTDQPPKSEPMDITVAVVTYNAAAWLRPCLESLLRQAPHGGALEILVVDGCSTDGTPDIARAFPDRVRLVSNPGRSIASNRNVALREARHPFLAFTDSDCVAPDHWLRTLADGYRALSAREGKLAAVGGGNHPPAHADAFAEALGIAQDSFLGSLGSVQGRHVSAPRPVPSLACLNVLYDRAALQSVGGFDEELRNMCEDADVNVRLRRAGWRLLALPGAEVEHRARPDLAAWCRNMYAYGIGRARLMAKHGTVFSPAYLLAVVFLPALLAGTAMGFVWPPARLAWLYVPLVFLAGVLLAAGRAPRRGLRVGLILLGTQLCYAAGLWAGFLQGYPRTDRTGGTGAHAD